MEKNWAVWFHHMQAKTKFTIAETGIATINAIHALVNSGRKTLSPTNATVATSHTRIIDIISISMCLR